jgi:GNAT superfamily N-acetyltransferase
METAYYDIPHRVTAYLMELDAQCYLLTELQTGREFRGQGHAAHLLDQILIQADQEGVTLCLTLAPDNSLDSLTEQALLAFYARRGFAELTDGCFYRPAVGHEPHFPDQMQRDFVESPSPGL